MKRKIPDVLLVAVFIGSLFLTGMLVSSFQSQALAEFAGDEAGRTVTLNTANPAAVYCMDLGYEYAVVPGPFGQVGNCTFPDGQACDGWDFLAGQCGQAYSYCAQQGYGTETRSDGQDPFSSEYAVCVGLTEADGGVGRVIGSVTTLTDLATKMEGAGCASSSTFDLPGSSEEPDTGAEITEGPVVGEMPAAPAAFDWRSYSGSNWLTSVKNQGGCGSCWAFAAIGTVESQYNINSGNPAYGLDLSEQYLSSDCLSGHSCCGGSSPAAFTYMQNYGIPDDACMTYVDGTGCSCGDGSCPTCTYTGANCSDRTCSDRCGDWASRLTSINGQGSILSNPSGLRDYISSTGPVVVYMGIGSGYGGYFDGDIYRCTDDDGINHAVVAVGYDDASSYWIIRNSWGTTWGDSGYFKVGYGECDIDTYGYYPVAPPAGVGPLAYDHHLVDDDNSGDSSGNGDGVADCGETVELYVDLHNQALDTATGVNATISTTDPYVTWIDNTSSAYPDVPGVGIGTNSDDFDFIVSAGTPQGHPIDFNLNITATNGGPWTDTFTLVACPSTGDIVINEVDPDTPDLAELYNADSVAINMTNWHFMPYDSSGSMNFDYTFPAGFTLPSGAYVTIHEYGNSGMNTATDLYTGQNINWISSGAVALTNEPPASTSCALEAVRFHLLRAPTGRAPIQQHRLPINPWDATWRVPTRTMVTTGVRRH